MEIGVGLSGGWQFGIPDRRGELAAHHLCPKLNRFARIGRIVSEMIDSERASRRAHTSSLFKVDNAKSKIRVAEPRNWKSETRNDFSSAFTALLRDVQ